MAGQQFGGRIGLLQHDESGAQLFQFRTRVHAGSGGNDSRGFAEHLFGRVRSGGRLFPWHTPDRARGNNGRECVHRGAAAAHQRSTDFSASVHVQHQGARLLRTIGAVRCSCRKCSGGSRANEGSRAGHARSHAAVVICAAGSFTAAVIRRTGSHRNARSGNRPQRKAGDRPEQQHACRGCRDNTRKPPDSPVFGPPDFQHPVGSEDGGSKHHEYEQRDERSGERRYQPRGSASDCNLGVHEGTAGCQQPTQPQHPRQVAAVARCEERNGGQEHERSTNREGRDQCPWSRQQSREFRERLQSGLRLEPHRVAEELLP